MVEMVRSGGIRGFEDLVRGLGGNPALLLRRYRIAAKALRDEDALISFHSAAVMVEAAAIILKCPDFGLRLGAGYDPSVLGPLAAAVQNAATVVEALERASQYLFLHTSAMTIKAVSRSALEPRLAELRVGFSTRGWTVGPQTVDACVAGWHALARSLAGPHYRLEAVCLPHEPAASLRTYRRVFGAEVRVAQPYAALLFAPQMLKVRIRGGSRLIQQLAEDYLRNHSSLPHRSVALRVREVLQRTLGAMAIDKPTVAAMLAMHPRTLQRHLAEEGTSYEALLDEVRKHAALRYLQSTRLPFKQITGLVGLSQQPSLSRYCRRWFGVSPTEVRNPPSGGSRSRRSPPRASQ